MYCFYGSSPSAVSLLLSRPDIYKPDGKWVDISVWVMPIEIANLMLSMLILNWKVYPIWTTEFAELSLKKSPCKSLLKSTRIKQTIQEGKHHLLLKKIHWQELMWYLRLGSGCFLFCFVLLGFFFVLFCLVCFLLLLFSLVKKECLFGLGDSV